jgi:hypothetical protein
MKFILVNHKAPLDAATCAECAQALGNSYLREVSTQRQYCDHDCYARCEARSLFMPWLKPSGIEGRAQALHASPFEVMRSLAATSCWYSISFAKAGLRVAELMAAELSAIHPTQDQ